MMNAVMSLNSKNHVAVLLIKLRRHDSHVVSTAKALSPRIQQNVDPQRIGQAANV